MGEHNHAPHWTIACFAKSQWLSKSMHCIHHDKFHVIDAPLAHCLLKCRKCFTTLHQHMLQHSPLFSPSLRKHKNLVMHQKAISASTSCWSKDSLEVGVRETSPMPSTILPFRSIWEKCSTSGYHNLIETQARLIFSQKANVLIPRKKFTIQNIGYFRQSSIKFNLMSVLIVRN